MVDVPAFLASLPRRPDWLIGFQHGLAINLALGKLEPDPPVLIGDYALARPLWKDIERRSVERDGLWRF